MGLKNKKYYQGWKGKLGHLSAVSIITIIITINRSIGSAFVKVVVSRTFVLGFMR